MGAVVFYKSFGPDMRMMMYTAVILLCSVLATNANVVKDDFITAKDVKSPSTIEEVDDIPVDVAEYDEEEDEEDVHVDQLDDDKMADELFRDIAAGKIKDPSVISAAVKAAKYGYKYGPHVVSLAPVVVRLWQQRRRRDSRRRSWGRWGKK